MKIARHTKSNPINSEVLNKLQFWQLACGTMGSMSIRDKKFVKKVTTLPKSALTKQELMNTTAKECRAFIIKFWLSSIFIVIENYWEYQDHGGN